MLLAGNVPRKLPIRPVKANRAHPLVQALDHLWLPDSVAPIDKISGLISSGGPTNLTIGHDKVGRCIVGTTSPGSFTIPTKNVYPWVAIAYGSNINNNGWSLASFLGSGALMLLTIQSNSTVQLLVQRNFAATKTIATTGTFPPNTPICAIAQVLSDTDYRLYVNGEVVYGTASFGSGGGGLTSMYSMGAQSNGPAYLLGVGRGRLVLSDEYCAKVTRDPLRYLPQMFLPAVGLLEPAAAAGTPYGLSNETDAAYTLAGALKGLPGLATEPDIAYAQAGSLRGALGLSNEADTAYAQAGVLQGATGQSNEADSAYAETGSLRGTFGLSTELDLAYALSSAAGYGLATEADIAYALAGSLRGAPGLATEADIAYALTLTYGNTYGLSTEADAAFALSGSMRKAAGLATEADVAYALSFTVGLSYGLSTESDAAFALGGKLVGIFAAAIETGIAYPLTMAGLTITPTKGYAAKLRPVSRVAKHTGTRKALF